MAAFFIFKERGACMKERLQKLLCVKSIVTIALTAVFCYLSIVGKLETEFLTIYTTIIAFYFGTQATKDSAAKAAGKGDT